MKMQRLDQAAVPPSTLFLLFVGLLALLPSPAEAQCVSSCSSGEHTITLQNNCVYPIWVANAANLVGGSVIGKRSCTKTSDCCVTLPSGTVDCTGVNCVNGTCSQINCTKDSDCKTSKVPAGLVSCNVPLGVQCSSDGDCSTWTCENDGDCPPLSCGADSDCPPGAKCQGNMCQDVCQGEKGAKVCTGLCQDSVCACKPSNGCPGAGTICDASGSFGTCAGGACQYNGLVPANDNWELAATCSADTQCASGQTCQSGECTCQTDTDCAQVGGACLNGTCGQTTTFCMPKGWGGRMWGRTGCTRNGTQLTCQTGQCGQGSSAALQCTDLAKGINLTATGVTFFEGTWDSNGTDYWDISLVNGYNVGMAIDACGPGTAKASCILAGETVDPKNIGCTSDLLSSCPPLLSIQGAANCITDSDCPKGGTCGADNLCTGSPTRTVTCIDPGDFCKSFGLFANNPVISPPACLMCNSVIDSTVNPTVTYDDIYNCLGPLSTLSCNNAAYVCFSDDDCPYSGQACTDNICTPPNALNGLAKCTGSEGSFSCDSKVNDVAQYECVSHQGTELCLPKPPTAQTQGCCGPSNPLWMSAGQAAAGTAASGACNPGTDSYAAAFKAACPNAYSYQYDDPSSSYQCSDANGGEVNYFVEFCPAPAPAPAPSVSTAAMAPEVEYRGTTQVISALESRQARRP